MYSCKYCIGFSFFMIDLNVIWTAVYKISCIYISLGCMKQGILNFCLPLSLCVCFFLNLSFELFFGIFVWTGTFETFCCVHCRFGGDCGSIRGQGIFFPLLSTAPATSMGLLRSRPVQLLAQIQAAQAKSEVRIWLELLESGALSGGRLTSFLMAIMAYSPVDFSRLLMIQYGSQVLGFYWRRKVPSRRFFPLPNCSNPDIDLSMERSPVPSTVALIHSGLQSSYCI